jgi:hypothetical protein
LRVFASVSFPKRVNSKYCGVPSKGGRPLLRNVYNKNAYFNVKGVKTSSVSAETNTLTTAATETVKLKDSTRCSPLGWRKTVLRRCRNRYGQLRGGSRQTVKTDTEKSDTGRQLK